MTESPVSVRKGIASLQAEVERLEAEISGLRGRKATIGLVEAEQAHLRRCRAELVEAREELDDAHHRLAAATAWAESAAGRQHAAEGAAAAELLEALAITLGQAAAAEDAAAEAWERAIVRRVQLHAVLRDRTAVALGYLPGAVDAGREQLFAMVGSLTAPSIAAPAVAWRIRRALTGTECDQLVQVHGGFTVDANAELTVVDAVAAATASLLRRVDESLSLAGLTVPKRGTAAARDRAAQLAAIVAEFERQSEAA